MNSAMVLDVGRDAIVTFLKVGGPVMLVALFVGLIISLFQALTQIQEQTLIFMLPFMGDAISSYMTRIAERIVSGG
jgi:flagellar biosynthesis protein FliQ